MDRGDKPSTDITGIFINNDTDISTNNDITTTSNNNNNEEIRLFSKSIQLLPPISGEHYKSAETFREFRDRPLIKDTPLSPLIQDMVDMSFINIQDFARSEQQLRMKKKGFERMQR